MGTKRLRERLEDYKSTLERLKESLDLEVSLSVITDGVIQRFEFTYELAWKVLKDYLEFKGIPETRSPRDTFKEGFRAGIIQDGDAWIDMLQDRNLTAHTYNEKTAKEIYAKIKGKHYINMKKLYDEIGKEVDL